MFSRSQKQQQKSWSIYRQITVIGRFAVLSVLVLLVGITGLTFPAIADSNKRSSDLVSLVNPILLKPTFSRKKVELGITPTVWSNSDDQTIDLNPPIRFEQILSEIALSGFKGTQMAPKFPQDIKSLKRELNLRNLKISEPWVGTLFTIGKKDETVAEFRKQVEFIKALGGKNVVVAELGGAVHQQDVDPLKERPKFTNEQWDALTKGLNELGEIAVDEGVQLVYHPHIGTGVENFADVDRLMQNTKPKYVNLLLDTGHLYYAGVNPLDVTKKYIDRIKHVHLKNIRNSVLEESRKTGRSFLNSVRAGIFTVPGDKAGAINFRPILQELANVKYKGWLIVEAEQDPNKANPLTYALIARRYLRSVIGW